MVLLNEEDKQPDEDKRKDKAPMLIGTPKTHPTGEFGKMVAVHCFVQPLALRLVSEAVRLKF